MKELIEIIVELKDEGRTRGFINILNCLFLTSSSNESYLTEIVNEFSLKSNVRVDLRHIQIQINHTILCH